ncbi:MAG: dTMP kinase, partial [Candidatus Cloacimonadota bacterium]|nr:dTMP kinase [Candidatus Cloacimonadota bacterium]
KSVFTELNLDYLISREPGGVKISEDIRKILLDSTNTEMDSKTEALLYAAARRQHLVEKIFPALESGKIIILDRFIDSSLAYQGFARELGIQEILKVNNFATDNFLPDITFLIDVDAEIALKRINNRKLDRIEQEDVQFFKTVRNGYLKLSKMYKDRYIIIDGSQEVKYVKESIRKKFYLSTF